MKFNKIVKEDYSKIIGQIDSLKTNITQLISVNQDTNRTVRITEISKGKSPLTNRMKTSRTAEKEKKKRVSQNQKQNKKTQSNEPTLPQKLWEKLIEVERSNQQIKNSHLVLQEMLRVERERRVKLEWELKATSKQKNEIGVQKDLEPEHPKVFTPQTLHRNESSKRKPSKTRDEGDLQSFLLGDCEDYTYSSSPKRRNIGQIEIMQLMQQISKPCPFDRRQDLKTKLLEAVKRFNRKW